MNLPKSSLLARDYPLRYHTASDRKLLTGPGPTYDTAGGWNRNPGAEATATDRNDSPDTRLTTHNTSAAGPPSPR